jgi:phosphate/sulfate permease
MQVRRPLSHWLLMLPFIATGLNAAIEAAGEITQPERNMQLLGALQFLLAATSLLVLAGIWQKARWSTTSVIVWGAIGAALVLSLSGLLGLSADESRRMPLGAAIVAVLAALLAWLVQRFVVRRPHAPA